MMIKLIIATIMKAIMTIIIKIVLTIIKIKDSVGFHI